MKGAILAVCALIVIAGIIIGGWQLGWWMKSYSTSRSAQIYQKSYGTQSADKQELANLISTIDSVNIQIHTPATPNTERSALAAQIRALTRQACTLASQLTTLPAADESFVAAHC